MDKYVIIAEVIRTEEYQSDINLWKIEYQYRPGRTTILRSHSYLLPKTFTPPRVGDKIQITVEVIE